MWRGVAIVVWIVVVLWLWILLIAIISILRLRTVPRNYKWDIAVAVVPAEDIEDSLVVPVAPVEAAPAEVAVQWIGHGDRLKPTKRLRHMLTIAWLLVLFLLWCIICVCKGSMTCKLLLFIGVG